jgi:hypothetical protein
MQAVLEWDAVWWIDPQPTTLCVARTHSWAHRESGKASQLMDEKMDDSGNETDAEPRLEGLASFESETNGARDVADQWTSAELFAELQSFEAALREAGLQPSTVQTYVGRSDTARHP